MEDNPNQDYEKSILDIPEGVVIAIGAMAVGAIVMEKTNHVGISLVATTGAFVSETVIWNKIKGAFNNDNNQTTSGQQG